MADNMNLRRAKSILENISREYDIDLKFEVEDDHVYASNHVTARPYDDDIFLSISVYKSGFVTFSFYFDYLEKSGHVLDLVNNFNQNVFCLKASITDKGCLRVTHEANIITDDVLEVYTHIVLGDILDDRTVEYLRPLTDLTTGE